MALPVTSGPLGHTRYSALGVVWITCAYNMQLRPPFDNANRVRTINQNELFWPLPRR